MAHDITYLFQFGAKSSKCNIVSDSSILNIKRLTQHWINSTLRREKMVITSILLWLLHLLLKLTTELARKESFTKNITKSRKGVFLSE